MGDSAHDEGWMSNLLAGAGDPTASRLGPTPYGQNEHERGR